ncbi:SNF2 family N-terminal domain-containing protein [Mycena belliarum]|uniref:SNF2 family N-terminal domain-containing protein n=1 Tax=Mycena belliarum TaxID=1033014 RepID=A0AAD6XPE3_9AGAR|nr:SNF2 family N-terminal domain-containing protein [Mycena belliae]
MMHSSSPLRGIASSASTTPVSTPGHLWSSVPASTAPSSPAPEDEVEMKEQDGDESVSLVGTDEPAIDAADEARFERLEFVLEKSAVFSALLTEQMNSAKERHLDATRARRKEAREAAAREAEERARTARPAKRQRKGHVEEEAVVEAPHEVEEADDDNEGAFPQPALVTGARLKDYQLEGLQWMVSLHENGISGILADEMGLGKTLQTIAFSAHLRELGFSRPFLIVCPLSVLHNWAEEYRKFAPEIPVVIYHGTPAERAALRRGVLALPDKIKVKIEPSSSNASTSASASAKKGKGKGTGRPPGRPRKDAANAKAAAPKTTPKTKGKAKVKDAPPRTSTRGKAAPTKKAPPASPAKGKGKGRASLKRTRAQAGLDDEGDDADLDAGANAEDADAEAGDDQGEERVEAGEDDLAWQRGPEGGTWRWDYPDMPAFPVVLTTYELIIKDRPVLGVYPWGYIVVDEGHRLKNMRCALVREVKRYTSAGRMVLTGTPLHNNLAELWSLLNFVLPDIFDDVDAFQEWFSLPRMATLLPSARMGTFIGALHAILKPFLLRRMKVDVLGSALPPKKSYVLYARLSAAQHTAYEAILSRGARGWLAGGVGTVVSKSALASTPSSSPTKDPTTEEGRTHRHAKGKGKSRVRNAAEEEAERLRVAEAFRVKGAAKHVNNMKLQNTVMQLRKVCSHPFLFARADDDAWSLGRTPMAPEVLAAREAELLGASGKMLLLDRLLGELFRRGHKVLLFSQFTTMLDIIEDWAVDMKGWAICRIDGTTPPLERRDQMNLFQDAGDAPGAPRLFLLSTRAGGLGVNLTAADTVIFYDQDWNPQMDAQAQDRAHRIGQTKPVLIFRLVSAHTIEEKIMQRATEKRKLEALVIAKGKFKMPAAAEAGRRTTMAEMAADLLRLEGEQIDVLPADPGVRGGADVLSDADLEALLDRTPAVFADRGTGWRSAAERAAFAVFEPPVDGSDDALAGIMGEADGAEAE